MAGWVGASYALVAQNASWPTALTIGALAVVLVVCISWCTKRLRGLLGPVTAFAAVAVATGTVLSLGAWASPSCPGGGGGRCDAAEAGVWWLNGVLLVGAVSVVGFVGTSALRALKLGTRVGAWSARRGTDALERVATRSDGLFRRPLHRDPLFLSGGVVALAGALVALVISGEAATIALSFLCGGLLGGVLPAAWRLSIQRPDIVANNRQRFAPKRKAPRRRR